MEEDKWRVLGGDGGRQREQREVNSNAGQVSGGRRLKMTERLTELGSGGFVLTV